MSTIEEKLDNLDWENSNQVIDFYESNKLYFSNYQLITDTDKISDFIDIKKYYANYLFDKSKYKYALELINETNGLLEKLGDTHWNYIQSTEEVLYLKGMIHANKREFKESFQIFKELVNIEPENYHYISWYNHSKLGLYNWVFNGISIICVILMFGDLLFSWNNYLSWNPGIVGVIILIVSYLTQKGLWEYYKRKKTATNNVYKK